ncbi:polyprenyl synthetase family protein [Saccharomonospora xinjiangensis]|uniref:Geranylgeranyl pyrophosphate synthase n=1 Tax=Saccharomonospora xinjiangensis XJ-54 TaxID=882086 RepID=I0V8G9_9PSEU|nr:polyprenyl synthetase family protein [Saccharomonospora xinjiangensis]EID56422.1 geranylgeranyl pyrophosphate synthase [Saccharomonospora xinjiangensis XJ-54]QBQ60543.1 Heptaprenyl diphosphate synthase component 2 [Saccharomonospora xinjiangensis]
MRGPVTIGAADGTEQRDHPALGAVPAMLAGRVADALSQRWREDQQSLLASMCVHALVPSGKLFRPILLLESALAVGGDAEVVLPAAVGAECGHVASLVHDDIIDDDDLRRGRPSVQHKFGVDNAIVAGDALIFDLFAALAECRATGASTERIVAALEVVARCGIDLCRGQSLEAELCERMDFDLDAYLTMVRLKTAALFMGACKCGALLAGGDETMVGALGEYALNLGCAFQIHDDVLSYTRQTGELGKPDTSDIRNGRLTLPVILAYRAATPEGRLAITDVLAGDGDPVLRRAELVSILTRAGALTDAADTAREYSRKAIASLDALGPTASRDRLRGFAEAAVNRDR